MPINTELIEIATDTTPLDGLFYDASPAVANGKVVQLFHGNSMNFYIGHNKFMPPALVSRGYSALAYNRRGHDILSIRDSREVEGAALQMTAEAIADNEYADRWLRARGYGAPICIGHSNGGLLAACHAANYADVPALVLLSAHIGGTEIVPRASQFGLFGSDQLSQMLEEAEQRVAAGRGDELMMMPGWYWVTTPRSILDYSTNLPSLLDLAQQISCPVLIIRGDQEPEDLYPTEAFKETCAARVDVQILPGCGHFYLGLEESVNEIVCDWLGQL